MFIWDSAIVCGDRSWTDHGMIYCVLKQIKDENKLQRLIVGGARGADTDGGLCGQKLGMQVTEIPAQWGKYGAAAGPLRNAEMLREKPDLILAFHDHIRLSKGTKDMCRRGVMSGTKTILFFHTATSWDMRELKTEDLRGDLK